MIIYNAKWPKHWGQWLPIIIWIEQELIMSWKVKMNQLLMSRRIICSSIRPCKERKPGYPATKAQAPEVNVLEKDGKLLINSKNNEKTTGQRSKCPKWERAAMEHKERRLRHTSNSLAKATRSAKAAKQSPVSSESPASKANVLRIRFTTRQGRNTMQATQAIRRWSTTILLISITHKSSRKEQLSGSKTISTISSTWPSDISWILNLMWFRLYLPTILLRLWPCCTRATSCTTSGSTT